MKVFVTGATGFIGSVIVQELIGAGHQVVGLARSDANAQSLKAAGAEVHRGNIEDLDSLKSGAAAADGVIHCGFIHDFARFAEVCELDRLAIEAMGSALVGTDKPFVSTSGTALVRPGSIATEYMMPAGGAHSHPRIASEQAAYTVANLGVRISVIRLSPSVHGAGDHGFVPILINTAREKGTSAYVGEGLNRWTAVHRLDAAVLYRLALEKNAAPGTRYHGVAEEGIAFKDIAGMIGKTLDIPVVSITADQAAGQFGWFSGFAALDCPASSGQTREQLGWHPVQPALVDDLAANYVR